MSRQSACNGPGLRWLAVALLALAFAVAGLAQAAPPPADDAEKAQLRQEIEQLKKALAAMEKRLDTMEKVQTQPVAAAPAQPLPPMETPRTQGPKPSMTVYGFAMLDMGQNFTQIDPNWFDTMRVSKLPSYENQYGEDNSTFAGVRQSRFGVKAAVPTGFGELKTKFEFDMFGTGGDAGQTTIRLRHAYGELGWFLAGQTDSVFSDPDVWPNSLEYWGPSGMVFFRNVQVRFTPIQDDHHWLAIALERPGASGDAGVYAERIEIQHIRGRNPLPDLSFGYKYSDKWGYIKAAGLVRRIAWDDMLEEDEFNLSGHATGWGMCFSSCVNVTSKDVLRMEINYGRGDENYMQDAPVDIGIESSAMPGRPIIGKPLPLLGTHVFLDHNWNERFSSSIGYSRIDIDNSDGQAADALRVSQYALANLLYSPVKNFLVGGEFQWGQRSNYLDGFNSTGLKLQFCAKYNFGYTLGGNNE